MGNREEGNRNSAEKSGHHRVQKKEQISVQPALSPFQTADLVAVRRLHIFGVEIVGEVAEEEEDVIPP
jgi:hypothetical protein